ncbi:hypothetical protein OAF24_02565 [bacterium]|nr:hypothetical protein [bacterium]MDB4679614.1 hypothetical protein [Planctomycetaceae bacterium]
MNWLKHAFAIDDGKAVLPSPHQTKAIDRVLNEVHRRGMALPASMALETCRPLNYVGSQLLVFFSPLMKVILGVHAQDEFARFLEKRGSIDYLLDRLEKLAEAPGQSDSDCLTPADGSDV